MRHWPDGVGGAGRGTRKTMPVADLGIQPERGDRADAAHAPKPPDDRSEGAIACKLRDLGTECVTALGGSEDLAQ